MYGGKRAFDKGYFFTPTVLADVPKDAMVLTEEVFAPVAPITVFDSVDEAIKIANRLAVWIAKRYLYGRHKESDSDVARDKSWCGHDK